LVPHCTGGKKLAQLSLRLSYNELVTILAHDIANILGIKADTIGELDQLVQRGLPKRSLERTLETVYAEKREGRELQAQVIPIATFKRRKTRLSAIESERTERLARVAAMAKQIWNEDEDATREWLKTPHRELSNVAPIEAALTEIGARRVEAILSKIFYGLPA
jgi:putative toxin-antitoxin system antitoxin component (TIGR02293 family)